MRGDAGRITSIGQRIRWAWEAALRVLYPGFSRRRAPLPMPRIAWGPSLAEKPGYRIVWGPYVRFYPPGGVAEWLKAHAWKACIRATVSRVRIPLPPPTTSFYQPFLTQHSLQLVVEHRYLTYASSCRLIEAHYQCGARCGAER